MTLRVRAVSDEEREQLGRMARSRTVGAGLVRRAQIILHALNGLKVPAISIRMDLCGVTVGHCVKAGLTVYQNGEAILYQLFEYVRLPESSRSSRFER